MQVKALFFALVLLGCGAQPSDTKTTTKESTPNAEAGTLSPTEEAPKQAAPTTPPKPKGPIPLAVLGARKTKDLKPTTLSGPYATLDDYCKASAKEMDQRLTNRTKESDMEKEKPVTEEDVCPWKSSNRENKEWQVEDISGLESPYMAKLIHQKYWIFAKMEGLAAVDLVMQTKAGWFGARLESYSLLPEDAGGEVKNIRALKEASLVDVIPGGAKELTLYINKEESFLDETEGNVKSGELLVLCGMGPSGEPGCYHPVQLQGFRAESSTDEEGNSTARETSWSLKSPYFADGKLLITEGEKSGEGADFPEEIKALFGAHPLAFP